MDKLQIILKQTEVEEARESLEARSDNLESWVEMRKRSRLESKVDKPEDGKSSLAMEEHDFEITEMLGGMMDKLRKMAENKKTVTKAFVEKCAAITVKINERVIKSLKEKEVMKGRLKERTDIIHMIQNVQAGKRTGASASYAEVTGRQEKVPKISGVGQVRAPPKVVIIRSKDKESEKVRKNLKEIVRPNELELKVRRLTKVRNGVRIEVEDEKSVENLLKNEALKKAGLDVDKPKKKRPVNMVYDVSADLTDNEIKNEIYKRNIKEEVAKDEYESNTRICYKFKGKGRGWNGGRGRSQMDAIRKRCKEMGIQILMVQEPYINKREGTLNFGEGRCYVGGNDEAKSSAIIVIDKAISAMLNNDESDEACVSIEAVWNGGGMTIVSLY
ncbi:hypothetical protein M0802_015460 [Mischocyttarus mexicanus]|nr:hypothetical protein M0802_015460 [Mischocyttarus mexicanus]